MSPRITRSTCRLAAVLLGGWLSAALAPSALAQAPTWVPLHAGATPGQPAEIVFDSGASSATDSFFDVFVHGYWHDVVEPGDGFSYERFDVPGLSHHGLDGLPDLPQALLRVAVPTTAPSLTVVSVVDLDPRVLPGVLPYPSEIPQLDGGEEDVDGTPAVFVIDQATYAGPAPWPASSAPTSVPVTTRLGSIRSAEVAVSMARWDPTSAELTLSAHTRVHLLAPGSPGVFAPITKDRAALAEQSFPNWPKQKQSFPTDEVHYRGDYLIVVHSDALGEIQDFIAHKTLQGFSIDVLLVDSLAVVNCASVRAAIGDWYTHSDASGDHYALLIGDFEAIPQCSSVTTKPVLNDDYYGSPLDGDLDEEIFVGRLSYDPGHEFFVGFQLRQIMEYELDQTGSHYGKALLVANSEDAPGKYEGNHAAVAAADYAVQPDFTTLFGSQPGSTDQAVKNAIHSGQGLVAYRGHGSSGAWSSWNLAGDNFDLEDVADTDVLATRPVVWSFSCWNNRIEISASTLDSIGETWMEGLYTGAVAHYGSTDISGTKQNHRLNLRMFEAVYDLGLLRHGHAIAWAEQQMAAEEPGLNSWMYMLLGDPSMRVRRGPVPALTLELPDAVAVGGSSTGAPWVATVVDADGVPQSGVLVTIAQPGLGGTAPALFANAYTDALGQVQFEDTPDDLRAVLSVGATDDQGQFVIGHIGTTDGAWTNFGGGLAGEHGAPLLVGAGSLAAGSPVSLTLTDGRADAPAVLFGSIGSQPVPFKGGTLAAFPFALLLNLVSDGQGAVHLQAVWPANIPADLDLWWQCAVLDPAAINGISLSNGLRSITP